MKNSSYTGIEFCESERLTKTQFPNVIPLLKDVWLWTINQWEFW